MKTVAAVLYSLWGLDNKQNYGVGHFHDWLLQNSIFPINFKDMKDMTEHSCVVGDFYIL